jgi:hypothetical protein
MDEKMKNKMDDMELENVAGGQTFWYLPIPTKYKNPVTGMVYEKGCLIRGLDVVTGKKGETFWKSEEEWGTWKDEMEYQGHEFVRGDANPKGD